MTSQWQDISTAPKDGTWFLAYDQNHGREADELPVVIVCWSAQGGDNYPWLDQCGMSSYSEAALTHWMPIPDAPVSA